MIDMEIWRYVWEYDIVGWLEGEWVVLDGYTWMGESNTLHKCHNYILHKFHIYILHNHILHNHVPRPPGPEADSAIAPCGDSWS